MKNFILFTGCFLLSCYSLAQITKFNPGDSENKSSLLNQPNSLGLDVTNEEITAEFNNFSSQRSYEHKILFGTRFIGGNSNKESSIFKGGDFTLGSKLEGFLGASIVLEDSVMRELDKLKSKLQDSINSANTNILSYCNQLMSSYLNDPSVSMIIKNRVRQLIFENISSNSASKLIQYDTLGNYVIEDHTIRWNKNFISKVKAFGIDDTDSIALFQTLRPIIRAIGQRLNASDKQRLVLQFRSLSRQLSDYRDSVGVNRLLLYFRGGMDGHKFTRVDTLQDGNLAFQKEEFRGGFVEGGLNFFITGSIYIGVSYRYRWTDNLSDLNSTSFSIKESATIDDKNFEYEKTEKAFTGNYYKFREGVLLFDLAWVSEPWKDDSRIMIYGFSRFENPNNKDSNRYDLDESEIFGIGSNYFKKGEKFLVGIYAEFPRFYSDLDFQEFAIGLRANYTFNKLF